MNLFKRLEVWLLLILAAGATLFVLWQDKAATADKPVISDVQPARADGKLTVLGCKLERDYGNARLDIEARLTNRRTRKLLLVAPAVKLLNDQGNEVPDFILPAEKPAEVPPNAEATVVMRFWLEQSDLQGVLTLDVEGERVEVKSAEPFDLSQLENARPRALKPGVWE